MRVMVTGAAGQLGATLAARLAAAGEVLPLTRRDLDISDEAAVLERASSIRPDVIVNCAAYNDVDGAEERPQAALDVNAFGVAALARAARACGAVFVHYGTDFIFEGRATAPYVETDPPHPLSFYGSSKLLGEWLAAEAPTAYVLRVESLFGGMPAKSSIDRILAGLRDRSPVRVFHDRTVTPSYVEDVVTATVTLLERGAEPGVYHCVNSGPTTWLALAEEAARLLRCEPNLVPISVDEVRFRAGRPRYCALSNEKLRRAGVEMPTWQDALARHVSALT